MALIRSESYPGRFDNPTTQHPQGAFKNRTTETSKDGSYLEKQWLNDWDGFFGAMLIAGNVAADGTVDEAGASQYFEALQKSRTAINKIKASQPVVTGATGNPLPTTTATDYASGDELAYGYVCDGAVTASLDSNGNLQGSGFVYIEVDADSTVSSMYGSVMSYDGTSYTQIYAGSAGLTLAKVNEKWRLTIDINEINARVFGISENLGRLSVDSERDITIAATGCVAFQNGETGYRISANGQIEQWGRGSADENGVSISLPIPYPNAQTCAMATAGSTTSRTSTITCEYGSSTLVIYSGPDEVTGFTYRSWGY